MVVLDFSLAQSPFYCCCFRLLTFLVDETQVIESRLSGVNFKQNMNNIAAVQLGASWPCLWFLITNGDRAKFFKYLKVVHHQVQNMVTHNCHSKLPKTSRQKQNTGKNNGFPFLDILGYLKNTHKNPKFGRVRPSSDVVLLPCRTKFRN